MTSFPGAVSLACIEYATNTKHHRNNALSHLDAHKFDPEAAEVAYQRAEGLGLTKIARPKGVINGRELKATDIRPPQPHALPVAQKHISASAAHSEFIKNFPRSRSRDQLIAYVSSRTGLTFKAAETAIRGY